MLEVVKNDERSGLSVKSTELYLHHYNIIRYMYPILHLNKTGEVSHFLLVVSKKGETAFSEKTEVWSNQVGVAVE